MPEKDYVKQVARAYADGDPDIQQVAQKALKEIDEARTRLSAQAYAIKQLQAVMPTPPAPRARPEPPAFQPKLPETPIEAGLTNQNGQVSNTDTRLSDAVKERARQMWIAEWQTAGRDLTAQEVVDLLKSQGVEFPVGQPAPSVGTVLGPLRRRYKPETPEPEVVVK